MQAGYENLRAIFPMTPSLFAAAAPSVLPSELELITLAPLSVLAVLCGRDSSA